MIGGRWLAFCSGVPNSIRIGPMWLRPCTGKGGAPIRANSSVMMICSLRVAPMPPYCLGQCGAIQPLRDSARYQGINSAGGGRNTRPRSATGRLASSQVLTSMRNSPSAAESRRNMTIISVPEFRTKSAGSLCLDVRGFDDAGPQRALLGEDPAEFGGCTDLDLGAEISKPRLRFGR